MVPGITIYISSHSCWLRMHVADVLILALFLQNMQFYLSTAAKYSDKNCKKQTDFGCEQIDEGIKHPTNECRGRFLHDSE